MEKLTRRSFLKAAGIGAAGLTLAACGSGSSTAATTAAATEAAAAETGAAEAAAAPELKSFRMGFLDTGSQDGTTVPLRNNYLAAIASVGAEAVTVQPAGNTPDDYLDALDTAINQGIDAIALPWVSFLFAGTPAAIKKCEDAGIYYGFFWGVGKEDLGDEALAMIGDSPLFLGCFSQNEQITSYSGMQVLHENGCDKLGYIGLAASEEMSENSRDYGIQKACEEFGMEILVEQRDSNYTLTAEGGATTMENFLAAYPEMQGLIIAGNTQYVMPGVAQVITSKGLTDFKVAAIDFPNDMLTYAEDGVLIYDAGAHITGPAYITMLAANAINGTPLVETGKTFWQQYVRLSSSEEIKNWVSIEDEIVYNDEEVQNCLCTVNPDFTLEQFETMVESYGYDDIMKRHHS